MDTTKTFADYGIQLRSNQRSGEVKTTCPECSHSRKPQHRKEPCMSVNVDKGVWNCHNCGWSGGLGQGIVTRPEIRKVFIKPEWKRTSDPMDRVYAYFAKRGINRTVVDRNQISLGEMFFPQVEAFIECIEFPFLRPDEDGAINIKYRAIDDKLFRLHTNAKRILYGLQDLKPNALIWVEGEIDKLSVEMAGYTSCVSVPDGAPTPDTKNYANKFDFMDEPLLADVKTHIIAVDADAAGVRLKEELIRRLGAHKCMIVTWPEDCKDANDVLQKHGADALSDLLLDAQPLPIEGTAEPMELLQQVMEEYEHGAPMGVSTGWQTMDENYRVLAGEWTLVTGIPGHGKSEWLDALTVNLAKLYGWNFGVFSPENQPLAYHVEKILEKYLGKPFGKGPTERMTPEEARDGMRWLQEHYTFVQPELPTIENLIEIGTALVMRKGIRGMVVDPWNEIDHTRFGGISETEYISHALTKLRTFARSTGVHLWIVAHPTKLQKNQDGTYPVPTPYDVAGSAHWRNKADNCVTVYRDVAATTGVVQIHIQKVRKKQNGKIGMVPLRWNPICGQYTEPPVAVDPLANRKLRPVTQTYLQEDPL